MIKLLSRYADWLHLRWPSGGIEPLPVVDERGRSNVPGLYITGDLSGIPLLKMAIESAVTAVNDSSERSAGPEDDADLIIIGGGVSGVAAAVEAKRQGRSAILLESNQLFTTIANFPKGKPIFTYPTEMTPAGDLQVTADVKEDLLAELQAQADEYGIEATPGYATHVERHGGGLRVQLKDETSLRAPTVIVAIGRSGNYRRLGVDGEDQEHVVNRLIDPVDYVGKQVTVVGGGDSACEAAIAIAEQQMTDGGSVILAYRGAELNRPKPDNVERVYELAQAGAIDVRLGTKPTAIGNVSISFTSKQGDETVPCDNVLALIGREAPLDFFRRSGVRIRGEHSWWSMTWFTLFFLAATLAYGMKGWIGPFADLNATWLNPGTWVGKGDPTTLLGTIANSAGSSGFWVTLAYSAAVVIFGIDRIVRRKTPYVTLQTSTLMAIQVLPLFILPEIILPWAGANGMIPDLVRENLFPGESWWRAYGFILAWPLMVWNIFTDAPLYWWLIIGFIQTFVLIPLLIWRWGKGAYCGWICSCGALAEGLGDRHREKMPHGRFWNKLNFVGQALLAIAFLILLARIIGWIVPSLDYGSWVQEWAVKGFWKHAVDFVLAGALGTGLYFWLSGRVWCRFACPLAALMHIYARFSQFRIIADKKKCISCNACTTVCHQGIDVMNFANKGDHMADPECVRCSACVQTCPTGVLQFGRVDGEERVIAVDGISASPVRANEQA